MIVNRTGVPTPAATQSNRVQPRSGPQRKHQASSGFDRVLASQSPRQQAAPSPDEPATAESVFGPNPWVTSPGGSGPAGAYGYNPQYFATRETAEKVAQLLGGKVVEANAMTGATSPFTQSQPNQMVQLPNGHLVNPGLTATYYTHGWSQAQIDRMLQLDRNV